MHNDVPAVAKQFYSKFALLFGVIVFAICLLGMTLVPMLAGQAVALTEQRLPVDVNAGILSACNGNFSQLLALGDSNEAP